MNKLPKSRSKNIVVQELGDEVLTYDTITDQAFCLNETSARVFNACDGQQTFDELKTTHGYTDELIYLALDELQRNNLLDESAEYRSPFAGMTRREVVRRVGLATMIALPIVSGVIAPAAANAASGANRTRGQNCTSDAQCTTGNVCRTTNNNAQRCCASTNTRQPQEPGTNLGGTSNAICTGTIGPQFCCSGSATNTAQGCVCNGY